MAVDKLEGRFEEDEAKDYDKDIKLDLFDVIYALDRGLLNITFTNSNGEPIYATELTVNGKDTLLVDMEDGSRFKITVEKE